MHGNGKCSETNYTYLTHRHQVFFTLRMDRAQPYDFGTYRYFYQHVGPFDEKSSNNTLPSTRGFYTRSHSANVLPRLQFHHWHVSITLWTSTILFRLPSLPPLTRQLLAFMLPSCMIINTTHGLTSLDMDNPIHYFLHLHTLFVHATYYIVDCGGVTSDRLVDT